MLTFSHVPLHWKQMISSEKDTRSFEEIDLTSNLK